MKKFNCPECGSDKQGGNLILEPSMEFFKSGKKPHQYETHFYACSGCHYYIPDRLAHSSSDEEYKINVSKWKKDFRPYAETIESFSEQCE